MVQKTMRIQNPTGLFLEPSGIFCRKAAEFQSQVLLEKETDGGHISVNAKSILSVLGACVACGEEITLICRGVDEEEALAAMAQIVEEGLGENEAANTGE